MGRRHWERDLEGERPALGRKRSGRRRRCRQRKPPPPLGAAAAVAGGQRRCRRSAVPPGRRRRRFAAPPIQLQSAVFCRRPSPETKTEEGSGRQDRKLAVARHRRRNGLSEFILSRNPKGIFCHSDESFLGNMTTNLVGSKYQIWDQGNLLKSPSGQSKRLLGVVAFVPTAATCTGSFRSMRAWIAKHQSMQLKNTNATHIQHACGLPDDWQEKPSRTHQLFSKIPCYNNMSKGYELDFRERAGRTGPQIRPSMKNFQMTIEENGRQVILQLGRIAKSKYVMDYRYPLTGYQAFCICLASIDSKLCCSV